MTRIYILWLSVVLLGMVAICHAGTQRYDYDPLGRLIRSVDSQGRVTEYVYDPVGNLLRVGPADPAEAVPKLTGIEPASMRRGESKRVRITGTGLIGSVVEFDAPGLEISGLQVSETLLGFTLAASSAAVLGVRQLRVTSASGTASTNMTVNPALPAVFVDPTPLAIPPDNVPRQIAIRLSHADTIDHVLSLSASNSKLRACERIVASEGRLRADGAEEAQLTR